MRRLPRRLLLWGGAAAVASGGFAFMASNNVLVSSAGEGTNTVSGYQVSQQTYTIDQNKMGGNAENAAVYGVTFTLTSLATTTNANGKPKQVWAYLEHGTGSVYVGHNYGNTGVGCTLVGTWTKPANAAGHGQYHCRLTTSPVVTMGKLDIEASQ